MLFLDELPEFGREALEILRQPLEDGQICIARTKGSYWFPSNIMLVAAMNPCPCGYYPDMQKCSCTYRAVHRYLHRISAPLLDRIDITVEVSAADYGSLQRKGENENSNTIRKRVMRTIELEKERYRGTSFRFNADLDSTGVEKYCALGKEEAALMKEAYEKLGLSARSYYRILKVARTIADMEVCDTIRAAHLQEAFCYRSINRNYWRGTQ